MIVSLLYVSNGLPSGAAGLVYRDNAYRGMYSVKS